MPTPPPRRPAARAAALLVFAALATSSADAQAPAAPAPPAPAPAVPAPADGARPRWTPADAQFMASMIGHHAQAVTMSRLAESHGASPSVRTLAARIINAQQDEIAIMQQWLRDRGQPVPQPFAAGTPAGMPGMYDMAGGGMAGMDHGAMGHGASGPMMPGMLTPAQMTELGRARGREFDRLFLSGMIHHHSGAVGMVKTLFGTYGAGQDEAVFKFASDVNVDQTTEIARMQQMLAALLFGPS